MAEGLNVRGRTEKRDFKPRSKSRSKSKVKIKCYHYHKEGHIRRICPERQKGIKNQLLAIASDGYESAEILMVSSVNSEKEWILDLGYTFHMTSNKAWFEELMQGDGGVVLLGNNRTCKVQDVGSVRVRLHNDVEKFLTNMRYIPE